MPELFAPFADKPSPGPSGCVFMTGGPRAYLPGLACVLHRMEAVGSKHTVVLAAPAEDAELYRPIVSRHARAQLMVMQHFPHSYGGKWGKTNVLDKLNVLGAPFGRVVWLDADIFVRRNVDELCALPDNVSFAAAPNVGFRPRTCFSPNGGRGPEFKCETCAAERELRRGEASTASTKPPCRYELNSAVMAVRPLSLPDFNRDVVRAVSAGALRSRDGGDQGTLNAMAYTTSMFGGAPRVLPSAYNALARVASLRPKQWEGWNPALIHLSRETKPWVLKQFANGTSRYRMAKPGPLQEEWQAACGALLRST